MSSSGTSSSPWEPLPLHRHLSSVGIGPVFVCPPSQYELPPPPSVMCGGHPDNDNADGKKVQQQQHHVANNNSSTSFKTTWEIIGDIKSTPQDFIVREIGWCPPSKQHHDNNSDQSSECNDRSFMNKYTRRKGWRRGIAGLMESDTCNHNDADVDCSDHQNDASTMKMDEKTADQHIGNDVAERSNKEEKQCMSISDDGTILKKSKTTPSEDDVGEAIAISMPIATSLHPVTQSSPPTSAIDTTQSPDKVLRQVLTQCYNTSNEMMSETASDHADSIMKQLASLQTKIFDKLKDIPSEQRSIEETTLNDADAVWISTSNLFKDDTNKGSWKLLHETVRKVYPLLKTENASHPPASYAAKEEVAASDVGRKDDEAKKITKNAWVCAIVDDCFFSLIPYLLHPAEDLMQLYKFRSLGAVASVTNEDGSRSNQTNNRKKNRWKKGKKGKQSNNCEEDRIQPAKESKESNANDGKVLLHLKPDIPRTERRNIHQIVTGKNRKSDFETSTRNDVPIDNGNGKVENYSSAQTTTAIVVQWSSMALQNLQKKRKRDEFNSNSNGSNNRNSSKNSSTRDTGPSDTINALFCTLKKEHVEHQVAIHSLMRALKCRPGDIGLAGIKDMKAITYQFCTLRNVDMRRAQRPILDSRVSLFNFTPVQNFLLDRGRLLGNQFEITLRNLRQIERLEGEGDGSFSWKERTVPVKASHLDAMVDRVTKHGFINFYGEQRVGDAGEREYVGVRSFDVGRALLKEDFSLAVDLIMEGRSSKVYNPTQEEVNARQTWKATKDARATLKEFPKSRNIMVRERDLMRGLLRYDDPLEAIKTVPHNTRTFWVHAYQSFVWNQVATERVRRHGVQPIKGDLYLQENESDVRVVTDPDRVNMSQVVLPLPGYTIQYPENDVGELCKKILDADGVQLSVKNDTEEASAKGSYRKLIQNANNLKWGVVDADEGVKCNSSSDTDPVVDAARFTFDLESGCYATMMLRELMLTTMARGDGKC